MYAKLAAFLLVVTIIACASISFVAAEPGYRRHYGGYGHGGGGGGGGYGHRGYGHGGGGGGGGYGHRGYGYGK